MIDLYGMSSPNVSKVIIMLEELGLEYRTHHVAVFRGAEHTVELVKISPFGKVPAIIDHAAGDLAVFESGAILTYLAETYGDGSLLPASGPARYAVLQWLVAQVAAVGPLLGQNNHFRLLPGEAGSYGSTRYAEQAKRVYRVLDERLKNVDFLAGGAYSIADIATYPWALYVPRHDLDWADYPALKAWCDRVGARPAVARGLARTAAMGPDDVAIIKSASPAELDSFFWRETAGPVAEFFPTTE